MKCIICNRKGGNDNEGVITLQSTPSGSVCPTCVHQLVADVIQMRTPWTKEDIIKWGLEGKHWIYDSIVKEGEEE